MGFGTKQSDGFYLTWGGTDGRLFPGRACIGYLQTSATHAPRLENNFVLINNVGVELRQATLASRPTGPSGVPKGVSTSKGAPLPTKLPE